MTLRGVCRSRSWMLSKRITVSWLFSPSGSHAVLVFPYQTSWQYCDGDPIMGASNAGGVGKNRNSRISGYRSTTAAMRTTTMTIHHAVYRTYCHASVNLCLSQPAWTTTTKRREQNLFVRSGKSEEEVTNNRRLHSMYCTTEANYWQTWSTAQPLCDRWATCMH